ncbi:MAG: histidine kinase N-terminal 7TM domain-containing protein, partial [Chloroflexota bacterium]
MFNVQFTPLVVPMLLAAGLSGFLAYYQWKRGPEIGMASFVTLMIGAAIWTATSALELASPTLQAKFIITVVSYLGVTMATAAWFTFTLEYTGQEKLLTPRYIAFLAVEPVLAITMAATNPLHHLFWRSFELSSEGALAVVHGPAFWGHVAYSYLLMLAGAALLIREFIVSPQHYRGQVIALLLAAAAPWAANFLYISQLSPIPNLDLTPFGFTFTGVFLSWNMIHYRLLDVIPIARHTVIQSMGDAMFVLDTRDRILDANPAALHLLEYTPTKKLFGQPMEQVLPPWAEIAKAGHPPGEADHEFKLEAEGEARDIRMHVSPVHNRRGEVRGRVLLLRDITSQKQAEEDLRGVLTAMRDAIMVLDSEGHYLRVPHTNYDLPFQLPADLVGKKMHDIFPAPKVEEFLGYIREALETGKTLRAEYSLPVGEKERWINASISPMEGDRVVWVSRDMTERKRAEEALHESEERFRMLFHDSPDAIVLLDPSVEDPLWPIVDCNEAFLVMNGFERDELIGQSIDVVHDTQGTPEEQRAFLRRIQREGLAHGERLHQRKDGSTYPIHFMAKLVNLNGKQLMLGVDRDISERRQAEEALHESEARFRMLFHHSPDAIALLDPSVDAPSWPIVD